MSEPIQSIAQNNYILATQQEVSHDNTLSGNGTVDSPLGLNETVLWEGSQSLASAVDITNLPESLQNFKYIRIHYKGYTTHSEMASTLMSTTHDAQDNTGNTLLMAYRGGSGVIRFNCCFVVCNGTTLSIQEPNQVYIQGGQAVKNATCNAIMTKVVGINRIANN